jgi:hypothetical protein
MLNLIEGRRHRALAGADALFQAAVLRAIYQAAETGREVVVRRESFVGVPTQPTRPRRAPRLDRPRKRGG